MVDPLLLNTLFRFRMARIFASLIYLISFWNCVVSSGRFNQHKINSLISSPGFAWGCYIDKKILFIHVFGQSMFASVCLLYGCLPRNWIKFFVLFMTQGYFWKCVLLSRQFLLWSIALAGGHRTELPPLARVSCVAPTINLHRLVRSALCLDKTICAELIFSVILTKGPQSILTGCGSCFLPCLCLYSCGSEER